ncbi:MAG: fasciclin domain-containing protein [Prevotella sp.]|nr:fasciclin domain-containing protein [Prevotella sp.]
MRYLFAPVVLLLCFTGLASCSDKDEHYDVSSEVSGRISLWEMISQQPEISTFASLLQRYSYDKILSGKEVYTVWAPQNDALADIDPEDSLAVTRMIITHIARASHPATGSISASPEVYMLNAKKLQFLRTGDDSYTLDGVPLQSKNRAAKNGVLHTLDGRVSFFPNIWQTMEEADFESIRNYLYAFSKREFVPGSSTQIDYNEDGMIVYDSIFDIRNEMWSVARGAKGIGWLNNEDSIYTMILPTNQAWQETYERYYPLFKPDPYYTNPDSIQHLNTQYSIVQDLVFRGAITSPSSYGVNDSIVSTRGAVIKNPSRIFEGSVQRRTSNGWVYATSQLRYDMTDTYVKPIRIEAEQSKIWHNETSDQGYLAYQYMPDNPAVSNGGFLYIRDNGTSSATQPSVSIEIPGLLATKYDISVSFLAPVDVNPSSIDTTVTRVKFEVQRWTRLGPKTESKNWVTVPGTQMSDNTSPKFVTYKRKTHLLKATEKGAFEFPFANFNETDNVYRLKITAYTERTDQQSKTDKFRKDMRIDYLLFEPSN